MTDQNLKYTRVIAEFDGKEEHLKFKEHLQDVALIGYEYHNNYDALMPVWQKFRDLKFVRMRTDLSIIHKTKCHDVAYAITHSTILEAFTALSEAIIWYNENKG